MGVEGDPLGAGQRSVGPARAEAEPDGDAEPDGEQLDGDWDLDSVTDEEMFALIDRELGIS
jgi:hypothetical protein